MHIAKFAPTAIGEDVKFDTQLTLAQFRCRVYFMYDLIDGSLTDQLHSVSAAQMTHELVNTIRRRRLVLDRQLQAFTRLEHNGWAYLPADMVLDQPMIDVIVRLIDGAVGVCDAAKQEAKHVLLGSEGTAGYIEAMTRGTSPGGWTQDDCC